MNKISAEIIADSKNESGQRLTTFLLVFPRIVLAEFNTHRMLSRNSASSRAIPFETMLDRLDKEPFIPIRFQKDHSGMQGNEYFEGEELEKVKKEWLTSLDMAMDSATVLNNLGVTKQLCNRLLEPFLYHTVIVTASEWENFFALRAHPAAEIHIADLAEKMLVEYNKSTPKDLKEGEWHIPFGDNMDEDRLDNLMLENFYERSKKFILNGGGTGLDYKKVMVATARCARVSYLNYEGNDDYEADIKLHSRLSKLGHWSPFEHCAVAMPNSDVKPRILTRESGNFKGFVQYRKTFEGENKSEDRVVSK